MKHLKQISDFLIKEEKEMSNEIVEEFPIKVNIEKGWTGRYYTINVEPMKMRYETYLKLGDNLTSKQIEYGKTKYSYIYKDKIERYPNDVSVSQYDYHNGEASFTASTTKDIDNWLELYKDYVYTESKY